jgi:hypothetical protein
VNSSDTRVEFQRRRATAWRLAKPWQALMVMGWVTEAALFALYDPGETFRFGIAFGAVAVIGVSIVALTNIAFRHYRCPACDAVPRAHAQGGGVLLNPSECPACGVPLR